MNHQQQGPADPENRLPREEVVENVRTKIGIEYVQGVPGHSFRIRGTTGKVLPGMDCPLWFKTKAQAQNAAEGLVAKVVSMLRQHGVRATKGGTV